MFKSAYFICQNSAVVLHNTALKIINAFNNNKVNNHTVWTLTCFKDFQRYLISLAPSCVINHN
jgi:hypothetical protein